MININTIYVFILRNISMNFNQIVLNFAIFMNIIQIGNFIELLIEFYLKI